ncbi:MAG: phenylacetate--CoA ligase family protein, partial [Mesorhizobium sp.]
PCGRTNVRIRGWMGRADQRTKVKGMFVDPKQIADLLRRHPEVARARLVVKREGERDAMALHVEPAAAARPDATWIEATLREITSLGGSVIIVDSGSLPNDGKIISDERDYSK